jgi:hypothetical protein
MKRESNNTPNNEPVKTPLELKTIAAEKLQKPFVILFRIDGWLSYKVCLS